MPVVRVGRMARWQRWTTYGVLGACLATGVVYFARQDWYDLAPSANRWWWVAHGVTSLAAMVLIGAALSLHVPVTWRADRGRVSGGIHLALMTVLVATTLMLFYGLEAWHGPAHWVHAVAGVAAVVAFPAHVLWGRTRPGRKRMFARQSVTQTR